MSRWLRSSGAALGCVSAFLIPALLSCQQTTPSTNADKTAASQGATSPTSSDASTVEIPAPDAQMPAIYPGLHNVVTYGPGMMSGSAPEGTEGFHTLAAMGVRTVISVDGAAPDVAEAARHGIRYVHLPIGYNGMDHQRTLEISKAIQLAQQRDPQAPIYLHCHHGKHRSAGALGAAMVTLGYQTPESATARMKISGTAPNYTGLYQCVAAAVPATGAELAAVADDFPSVSRTSGLVNVMVEADEHFDHLRAIESAQWTAPADHPDLVPVAEAGMLTDLFRLLQEDEQVQTKPEEFRQWLKQAEEEARTLEDGLTQGGVPAEELSRRMKVIGASCQTCHAKYRD